MTREEAFIKLNTMDPDEIYLKEHRNERQSHTNRFSTADSHYHSETFSLNASQKLRLVKHSRYSITGVHDHDFFEIAYLFTGQCIHEFYLETGKDSTSLAAGDLVIIPPGLRHDIRIMDESLMLNILVHTDTFLSAFLSQLPENNTLYHFFSDVLLSGEKTSYILMQNTSSHLRDLVLDLYIEELQRLDDPGDTYSSKISEHLLQIFFLELIRSKRGTIEMSPVISEKEQLSASLLLFVENNYRKTSLTGVSDYFHFSKTYINRIFKQTTGSTIQQYIKQLRLKTAKKLLLDPTATVTLVAQTVGYHDTSYFIEEYKKMFGRTPRQLID